MEKVTDYYQILGLPRNASSDEIRKSFHRLAKRYHPDVNINVGAQTDFISIQHAYTVLSDQAQKTDYDKTLPPEVQHRYLTTKILFSRPALIPLDEPQLLYTLLQITPPEGEENPTRTDINICLVLDQSTSMQGIRMEMVKSSAIEITRLLMDEDIVSIVTFADRADVLLPATFKPNERIISAKIRDIDTNGGTEIFQGLQTAFEQVKTYISSRRTNHIVLITDGRTYGDEAGCLNLAHEMAELGIGINVVGIGEDWNDEFADELARITGGSSVYLDRPHDLKQVLQKKLLKFSQIYADDMRLHFIPDRSAKICYAMRVSPEVSNIPVESPILLGSITNTLPTTILFEFEINPLGHETSEVALISGYLTGEIPAQKPATFLERVNLSIPVKNSTVKSQPSTDIVKAVSRLTLFRMQENIQREIQSKNTENAVLHLQKLATNLLSVAEYEFAQDVLNEAEHVRVNQDLSKRGKKQIKYGTRALMISAINRTTDTLII
jgi:Ca-activated chloride channel family protein